MTELSFQRRWLGLAALAGLIASLLGFGWLCLRSDNIAFLPEGNGARWIVPGTPASAEMHQDTARVSSFRRTVEVSAAPSAATLAVRVFRSGAVRVNGTDVSALRLDGPGWKRIQRANVESLLRAGRNEVEVTVTNALGPPALCLRLTTDAQAWDTDEDWEATLPDGSKALARLASFPPPFVAGGYLHGQENVTHLLRKAVIPVGGLLVLAVVVCCLGRLAWSQRLAPTLAVPGLVGLLWIALLANNLPQLPRIYGFDAEGHEEYIRYIQERVALPLADEGWQMYQPPLYYALSAMLLEVAGLSTADEGGVRLLRAFNGAVGLAHCLIIFLCLRRLFPKDTWKPVVGTLFAGLLPAHLYLSHYVTNETLAATFVTLAIYFVLRVVCVRDARTGCVLTNAATTPSDRSGDCQIAGDNTAQRTSGNPALSTECVLTNAATDARGELMEFRNCLFAGLALGAALLTKFSAVLAAPVLLVAVAWPLFAARDFHPRRWLRTAGAMLGSALLLCGWHYARVWAHFGRPIVGNWDAGTWTTWWQEPGFRTVDYYTRFGETLLHPLFSGFNSFADGLYSTLWFDGLSSSAGWLGFRPPWNQELLGAALWLALGLSLLIVIGLFVLIRRVWRQADALTLLWLGLPIAFALGIAYMSLRVPSYAQVKAFYGLPALLPLCVLLLAGWETLARRHWQHFLLAVGFATWALAALAAFWVLPNRAQTHLVHAIWALDRGRLAEAAELYEQALQRDPGNATTGAALAQAVRQQPSLPALRPLLARSLQTRGQPHLAVSEYREALRLLPDDAALLNNLAWLLATHADDTVRNGPEAVRLAERACAISERREPLLLGTLAAAYAEAGRFEDAIQTATEAQTRALELDSSDVAHRNAELRELYRAGKPFREP